MTQRDDTAPAWADRYAVGLLLDALEVPDAYRAGLAERILADPAALAAARGFASLRETVVRALLDLETAGA